MNIDVANVIRAEIRKVFAATHYDRAPVGTAFPYAVFKCPSSFQREDGAQTLMLEVDIWSNTGNNITALEATTILISSQLHNFVYSDPNMALQIKKESVLDIPEQEEQIRRRLLRFTIKYYSRR